ncbi:MAG: sugar phosphate isomerase/epimerase family protein [Kiritimatiellia bacterium]|jgi:sugar phosphate isomerase/epimerase
MRIALSTNWNSFRHETADAMLEEIVSLGFDTVELGYALTHRQAEGVAAWREAGRIRVCSVHAFCPSPVPNAASPELFSICDPRDFRKARRGIAAVKSTADFAASVGARAVVLHAGRVPLRRRIHRLNDLVDNGLLGTSKYQRLLDRALARRSRAARRHLDTLCESLAEILPHIERLGLVLGLENLPTLDAMPNEPEMQILLDSFRTPALGYWHDAGHAQARQHGGLIHHAGIVARFADWIAGLHLHDVAFPNSDHRMPPAGGTVDFAQFARFLDTGIPFVLEPARGSEASSIRTAVEFLSGLWQLPHKTSPPAQGDAKTPHEDTTTT